MNLLFNLKKKNKNTHTHTSFQDVRFLYLRGTWSEVTFKNFSTENYPKQCISEAWKSNYWFHSISVLSKKKSSNLCGIKMLNLKYSHSKFKIVLGLISPCYILIFYAFYLQQLTLSALNYCCLFRQHHVANVKNRCLKWQYFTEELFRFQFSKISFFLWNHDPLSHDIVSLNL